MCVHIVRLQIRRLRLRWGESAVGAQSEGLHQNSDMLSRANHSPHVRQLLAPVQTLREGKLFYQVKYLLYYYFLNMLICLITFLSFIQVHVNLLLMEARMQAELLYALRAITHYMTWPIRLRHLYDLTNQTYSPTIWPLLLIWHYYYG